MREHVFLLTCHMLQWSVAIWSVLLISGSTLSGQALPLWCLSAGQLLTPNTPLFLNLVNELRIRVLEGKVLTIRNLKRLPRLKRFGKKFVRFLVWGRPLTGTQEGKGR